MAQSPFERKLDKIKHEVEQLKIDHDAVFNRLDNSLLNTQRILAKFMVVVDARYYIDLACRKLPRESLTFESQTINDIGLTRGKIDSSKEPLQLYQDFHDKCIKRTKIMGIHLIDLD